MMRQSIGKSGISDEALAAYFDGEASDSEVSSIRQAIEGDPELASELEQLGVMKDLTIASLEAAAAEVPEARFEQIWDQIDRAIDQGERLQASANEGGGLWSRILAALAPIKWPVIAAGAAAAVAVAVVSMPSGQPESDNSVAQAPNKDSQDPSVPPASDAPPSNPSPALQPTVPQETKIAVAPTEAPAPAGAPLALPQDSSAELHEIDGNHVRISNVGTVTVLYVEENLEDEPSERSL